jgi:hypothetical protein
MIRIALAFVVGLTVPALAQEDLRIDQSKLYVSDPAACEALETKGIDAFMDSDFVSLTFKDGIQSMEFHCNFFDVKSREGSTHLFVDAICELPGEIYPDIFAVTPYSETEIQVVSGADATIAAVAGMSEASDEVALPGATIYTRCDNLSEIPVD